MNQRLLVLSLMLGALPGCGLAFEWQNATVAEIQAVTADSNCAKKLLSDANRAGHVILHKDLRQAKEICVTVDQQAKAF